MRVLVMPANKSCEVNKDTTLLEALLGMEVFVESPCGGNHTCGKCKVLITKGNDKNLTDEEKRLLTKEEAERGMRMACSFKINEDITLLIPRKRVEQPVTKINREIQSQDAQYGLAVDIGTTTVEIDVVNLMTGNIAGRHKFFNPQIAFGADVIARITYCVNHENGEEHLREVLLKEWNQQLKKCLMELNINIKQVKRAVFVGNTTMSYLLSGRSVKKLAKAPFQVEYMGNQTYPAKEFGVDIAADGDVYIASNIAGHVGADAYACLINTKLNSMDGIHLLVDIGTNGEIVLSSNGEVFACSTAAGPAFEGAGITYGMRASNGAITKAVVNNGRIETEVIGHVEAEGISGSGIIDLLSCMRKLEVMDETGYIDPDFCVEEGYCVTKDVYITREDVRQIQLAKGAICAGIETLCKEANISVNELDGLYLAGAFGSNINIKNAMTIGLLPQIEIRKVHNLGNSAIAGAKELLLNWDKKETYGIDAKKIKHVELADLPEFRDCFIKNINFRSILF